MTNSLNPNNALYEIVTKFRRVYTAYTERTPVFANQGQALDGYSALAEFTSLAKELICWADIQIAIVDDLASQEDEDDV